MDKEIEKLAASFLWCERHDGDRLQGLFTQIDVDHLNCKRELALELLKDSIAR